MPLSKYIRILIDGQEMDVEATEKVPVAISYKLEDTKDFQKKKSSEAFGITFPATPGNDQVANTFHNPDVEDLTPESTRRGIQPALIEVNGHELLVGKALLQKATHTNRPISYTFDFYGNNADWVIDLKETTLFDVLQHLNFVFSKQTIMDSWAFDGRSEAMPFVFAPVRYGDPMETGPRDLVSDPVVMVEDWDMKPEYMKPALSKYWVLYWGFKSLGYRISSQFFDSDYFRRQVMPWTWGNFLFSEGTRLNNLDFLAKSTSPGTKRYENYTGFFDLNVSNDANGGGFDNNNTYEYDAGNMEMKWTYPYTLDYGVLEATFRLDVFIDARATANSDVSLAVQYFKNAVRVVSHDDLGNGTILLDLDAPAFKDADGSPFAQSVEDRFTVLVAPGDVISAKFYLHTFDSGAGAARITANVLAFEMDYLKVPLNGTIDFQNFAGLKKHKFLDLLRGVIDEFNLSIQTDPISKVVVIEPTHPYSLTTDLSATANGYFTGNFIDWSDKQDLSEVSEMELFSEYDRELVMTYKDDSGDGILKVVQDRYQTKLAAGKYVFPDRFKAGKGEIENRFFSPVMHYEVDQWRGLGSVIDEAPQMICIVQENISNTSKSEAQNTFAPKSAYYKGIDTTVGFVFDGVKLNYFPFMFAVNYKPGGENDPVLSYSDERIGRQPTFKLGAGLLRHFFLQRFAIMRNGQYYSTPFRLNNLDVTNWFHREHIVCRGQKWELVEITDYKPLLEQSTKCQLRRWVPVAKQDSDSTFPSRDNVLEVTQVTGKYDTKYSPLKCLASDIRVPSE